jgi:hypothetical protein
MKRKIDEITMIDAAITAMACGHDTFIVLNKNESFGIESHFQRDHGSINKRHAIAKVSGHKQFIIMDESFEWAVEPAKVHDIHMNRPVIPPWPRPFFTND